MSRISDLAHWTSTWPRWARAFLDVCRIDFRPRRSPSTGSVVLATVVALIGSLVVDTLLAHVGVAVFPAIRHYAHLRFSDYSKLTTLGILGAALGWPVVTRVSSQPTWLYLRAAGVVTLVLFTPDLAIWYLGQPAAGVFVLVWMHLAIALITFLSMITLAPVGRGGYSETRGKPGVARRSPSRSTERAKYPSR